ncbi:MAG: hypothetical protein U0L06_11100 [Agathobacter sp.]|nr:hypothetical protein [Agathobacter sp.]
MSKRKYRNKEDTVYTGSDKLVEGLKGVDKIANGLKTVGDVMTRIKEPLSDHWVTMQW